ncbi:MAG: hypothetical protein AAGD86_02225 [Pseudomonadota bacterium]
MKTDSAPSPATRATELPGNGDRARPAAQPAAELVDAFRARLADTAPGSQGQHPTTAAAAVPERDAPAHRALPDAGDAPTAPEHVGHGLGSQPAAPTAAPATPTDSAPAATHNAAALAALLERHVRTLMVSADGLDHVGAQMLFRLDGDALGNTDLVLTRTGDGWMLEAHTQSAGVLDSIRDTTDELEQRFARQGMGSIDVRASLKDV